MELTSDTIKHFNDLNRKIFKSVKGNYRMWLNGSYRSSPFASDIDLYAGLPLREVGRVCKLVKSVSLPLLKLRIGTQVFTNMDILDDVKAVRALLKAAPKTKRWLKPVWLVWTGSVIEEMAVIYDFGPRMSKSEVVASIREDIKKYSRLDLWKTLKRKLLLEPNNKRYRDILNDVYGGLMYMTRSRIDTLIKSRSHFSPPVLKKALGHLRQSVQVTLGHPDIPVTMHSLEDASSMLRSLLNDYLKH